MRHSFLTFRLILTSLLASPALWAADYYVAKNGSDGNPGTLAAPFLTIQKAADVAVAGDTVNVRAGIYRETVRPAASGADASSQITFQPYNSESVTISGADVVNGPWTVHSGNIWKCDVPADGSTDVNGNKVTTAGDFQTFVNGWSAIEARWPNNNGYDPNFTNRAKAGFFTSGNDAAGTASINYSGSPSWAAGAKINFWPGVSYFLRTGTVASRSTNFLNVTYTSLGNSAYSAKSGDLFFLWGKLEALDAAGECFFDTATNRLYLWAPHDADPNQLNVELKRRKFAFDLFGRNWITVRNFRLFGAGVNMASNAATLDGLNVIYASHLTQDVGTGSSTLIGMRIDGYANTIRNSDIAYSGGSGVGAKGHYLTVEDNIITDVNYIGSNFAGVYVLNDGVNMPASGNMIRRNTIVNCAASGIFYNTQNVWTDATPPPSRILNNRVSSVCLQLPDNGNIYTSGNGGNTEIAYNVLTDNRANATGNSYGYPVYGVTGAGLYLDIGNSNFDVHHNVTFGSMFQAMRVNIAGQNLKITHNTLLADSVSLNNDFPDTGANFTGNDIRNNIFRKAVNSNGNIPASEISATNLFEGTDPLFTNAANNDYTLSAASPAIDQGANLGYAFSGTAPDHGAYEYGLATWQAGPNITAQSLPAPTLLSATAGSGSATLKWLPAPGWLYSVWRSDTSGSGYQKIATLNNDTITYTNSGLTSGGPFYYVVKVERLGVESAFSNEIAVTPTGSWPAAPTSLLATAPSGTRIDLTWTDNASNETGHEVWRKSATDGTYTLIFSPSAGATSYSDTTVTTAETYTYRVRATNASGSSPNSNEASATPLNPYQIWADNELGSISADPMDDPDGDGSNNLAEYAFGTSPSSPNSSTFTASILSTGHLLQNGSFETDSIADGGRSFFLTAGIPSGWTQWNGGGTGNGYVQDYSAAQLTSEYSGNPLPDGEQVLGLGRGGAASVYQDLGTVTAGECYTLSGYLGRPATEGVNPTGGYIMALYVGTSWATASPIMTLNNANVTDPAAGTWTYWSGTSSVITAGQNGQNLYAFLYANTGDWPSIREFDNISVQQSCEMLATFTLVETATDLTYIVQTSTDMTNWTDGASYVPNGSGYTRTEGTGTIQASDTDAGATRTITEGILAPATPAQRRFVRIKVLR